MPQYTVLRDLGSVVATEGGSATRGRSRFRDRTPLPDPRVEVAELSRSDLRDLARDPSVRSVAPMMPLSLVKPVTTSGTVTRAEAAWGVSAVGADVSTCTGRGVTVAILDTGIDDQHAAFSGMTLEQVDFSGAGNGDRQGHGTHCAGTVFGRAVNGTRIGVAPGVEHALIGKVLGDDGRGSSPMLFQAMQWAVARGAQVISMSLGFDFPGMAAAYAKAGWPTDLATSVALEAYRANLRVFDDLLSMLRSMEPFGVGTVVVAAAGNESHRELSAQYVIGPSLPAATEGVLSIGALEQSGKGLSVASFSNTSPVLSAPGVDILSAQAGGELIQLSGTSMATPHVAGVAALWWEQVLNSPLPAHAANVVARLLASARTDGLAPDVPIVDRGASLVQAP